MKLKNKIVKAISTPALRLMLHNKSLARDTRTAVYAELLNRRDASRRRRHGV